MLFCKAVYEELKLVLDSGRPKPATLTDLATTAKEKIAAHLALQSNAAGPYPLLSQVADALSEAANGSALIAQLPNPAPTTARRTKKRSRTLQVVAPAIFKP